MIDTTTRTYATTVRESLAYWRSRGMDFDRAWAYTMGQHPAPDLWPVPFMQTHMRAAYLEDESRRARFNVPPLSTTGSASAGPLTSAPNDVPRCRSGDGCDREATEGTFGTWWCAYHFAELEALRIVHGEGQRERGRRIPGTRGIAA